MTAVRGGNRPAAEFDVCGPLPRGTTVLEASAGTGKTYTIAALTARYVAAGVPLERLLLVTFTRVATGELRERVRERLVATERDLTRALDGIPPADGDPVTALLADGAPAEVRLRRDRLARALAGFDAATIDTIHGFCQGVLTGLGTVGDIEPGITFLDSLDDLVDEVVDDLYVQVFGRRDERRQALGRRAAGRIGHAAAHTLDAPLAPAAGEPGRTHVGLARAVRRELEIRKRRRSVMTHDDVLIRLDRALQGPHGTIIAERLRGSFDVVLIDEFQDTDPVQWRIMHRAFAGSDRTLIVIADPKQAIYAFRGADVYAYLEAARTAGAQATLRVNRRADQPLIDALDALFAGAELGHPEIVYGDVRATEAHRLSRLLDPPVPAALRIRVLGRDAPVRRTPGGYLSAPAAREHIAADLAADVVALLAAGARIAHRRPDGTVDDARPVGPGDIAVLVRSNASAAAVRAELEAAGVPAVTGGAGTVFATDAATDWLRLLEALERPSSPTRAAALALTPFAGWSATRVAEADEAAWVELHARLHEWARVLRTAGVAALLATITAAEALPRRILAVAGGERELTDLRHVAELLHCAVAEEGLGPAALTLWLRRRIAEAGTGEVEAHSRRLESDARAVQVLTIHRSKGLEFPIVYAPFLWDAFRPADEARPVVFHDPDKGDARTVDVALAGEAFDAHAATALVEERGEDLRLAYVALTRARHQVVLWWAGSKECRNSALARLLFAREASGRIGASGARTPDDAAVAARLAALAGAAPGRVSVERSALGPPASLGAPLADLGRLEAAVFDRGIDVLWRRTSYSDITAGAHEAAAVAAHTAPADELVRSEPEGAAGLSDEPPGPMPLAAAAGDERPPGGDGDGGAGGDGAGGDDAPAAGEQAPALAAMGAGTRVGTAVHRALELVDLAAPDLEAAVAGGLEEALAFRSAPIGDRAAAARGLAAALRTPLGPIAGGRPLAGLARADRLDELVFELPLVGGDTPTGRLDTAAFGELLRERLPAADPLAGYADRLGDPALRSSVRGYLTGSIDLVARLAPQSAGEAERFLVVDYKTNWLAGPDEPLTAGHYRPAALAAEMVRSHYALQALLYLVALHRFLRWRRPGYDPDIHLAGVAYLFLRGMTGPSPGGERDRERGGDGPPGVFAWRPPAGLVGALSDLLDRGSP